MEVFLNFTKVKSLFKCSNCPHQKLITDLFGHMSSFNRSLKTLMIFVSEHHFILVKCLIVFSFL